MADEFDYDCDSGDFDDDGWLYVEDAPEDVADGLAENAIPSPGYVDTSLAISFEGYDFDLYSYFEDLEYGEDAYWDNGQAPPNKRKRGDDLTFSQTSKRRILNIARQSEGPVVYRSREERNKPRVLPTLKKTAKPFALLPDWRERFGADADSHSGRILPVKEMPADMERAASQAQNSNDGLEEGDENGWEDEEDEEIDDDAAEGGQVVASALASLDPDMLKSILQQRLAEAGLGGGGNEAAFMKSIQQMLSGNAPDGEEDDASGALARMLLGQATEEGEGGGNGAVSGWLEGQGVRLESGGDVDGEGGGESNFDSPIDSGISFSQEAKEGATGEKGRDADRDSRESSGHASRKRKADITISPQSKRAKKPRRKN